MVHSQCGMLDADEELYSGDANDLFFPGCDLHIEALFYVWPPQCGFIFHVAQV